jgi:hypothetical protein
LIGNDWPVNSSTIAPQLPVKTTWDTLHKQPNKAYGAGGMAGWREDERDLLRKEGERWPYFSSFISRSYVLALKDLKPVACSILSIASQMGRKW